MICFAKFLIDENTMYDIQFLTTTMNEKNTGLAGSLKERDCWRRWMKRSKRKRFSLRRKRRRVSVIRG